MIVPAPAKIPPAEELGRVHFVGIGGVGMSTVARIMLGRGLPVSGSEIHESRFVAELRALGAAIQIGQAPGNLDGVDTVVVSTAIHDDNVEVVEARRRGLRVLHRASALASLMEGRIGVAVAGTHGKTTTTAMLAVALEHCGADPSYAIGGELASTGANGHAGAGQVFIAEADESDGTFLHYRPHVAVVTNVEYEHAEFFRDAAQVDAAFADFADGVDRAGRLVLCADDPGALRLAAAAAARGVPLATYGGGPEAEVRVTDLAMAGGYATFRLAFAGRTTGRVTLAVPGRHNALNAAGAFAAALRLGFDAEQVCRGLERYTGARRRMELKGEAGGVRVYDDYMHHPTEIEATLGAFREIAGEGRLIVAFQPQRYARARAFLREFGPALGAADEVVVMAVYGGSGEAPIPGVNSEVIAGDVPLPPERVRYEPDVAAVPGHLVALARPGDVIVTAGAGNVTDLGPRVLDLLAARTPG